MSIVGRRTWEVVQHAGEAVTLGDRVFRPGQWYATLAIKLEDADIDEYLGPFDTRPELEKALLMKGVGHQDMRG